MTYRLYNPDGQPLDRTFNDLDDVIAYVIQHGTIEETIDNASQPGIDICMDDGEVWFAEIQE